MKNRLTVLCDCGKVLDTGNFTGNLRKCDIPNFYGGNVTHFCDLECGCGKKYVGSLKAENNGFRVIDTENVEDMKKVKKGRKK